MEFFVVLLFNFCTTISIILATVKIKIKLKLLKNTAILEQIEVKIDMSVKCFLVVIFTAIVVLMIYKLPKELFTGKSLILMEFLQLLF